MLPQVAAQLQVQGEACSADGKPYTARGWASPSEPRDLGHPQPSEPPKVPSCAGVWLTYGWPVGDFQPLGFFPSCDGCGHYVVVGVGDGSGTVTVVPFGHSPGVAHLAQSVSVLVALIHGQHRRGRGLSGSV